jgi:sphingolipid 4-desaturase/C4-monooxygenase
VKAATAAKAAIMVALDVDVHRRRNRAITKAHPAVKKLYGYDNRTAAYAAAIVMLQIALAYLCRGSFRLALLLGCTIGPFVDAGALCFIHEATHMLVFQSPAYNRVMSIFTNMVMVMPLSEIFRQHHNAHHKNLGDDSFDVDVPTDFEIEIVGNSPVRKALWLTFNMIILPARSLTRLPVVVDKFLILNWAVCLSFGATTLLLSRPSFAFLILSLLQSQGLHPANTRQVQEHVFDGRESQRAPSPTRAPTYSYYGVQNKFTLNVGWHLEHHDFPRIPWTRLPKLRAMAGDTWYPLSSAHQSRGLWNMYNFVMNSKISLADFAS